MDEARLREFVETEYPRLVGAVSLISGSRAAAEDTVQEALGRAWEGSTRGQSVENLAAWVTTVSLNLARSGLRRIRAEARARSRLGGSTPFDHAVPGADRIDLARVLRGLTRRQREATVLRYYLDLDVAEVADAMAAPEGTVKSLLHRARSAMAAALGVPDVEMEEVAPDGERGG
ncbi:MAG: sigma-70 family RNA polymerase sigma factor [Actinomycetota bacterium]|nr:sigma-70 family RNA polymerase sigma factor [Actinomycetota bacterium]